MSEEVHVLTLRALRRLLGRSGTARDEEHNNAVVLAEYLEGFCSKSTT